MPRSSTFHAVESLFALTAFVLMWAGSMRCDFVRFAVASGSSEPMSLKFGIWYYQFWSFVTTIDGTYIFESCHGYPDATALDPAWKAARAFSVITFVLAIVLFIVTVISICEQGLLSKAYMAPAYLLTALCQGLMLLLLQSDVCKNNGLARIAGSAIAFEDACGISTGAKLCISALVFWAAAGACSFAGVRAEKDEEVEEVEAGLREPLAS